MSFLHSVLLPLEALSLVAVLVASVLQMNARATRPVYLALALFWALAAALRPWGLTPDDPNYALHLELTAPFSEAGFENALGHSYLYYQLLALVRDIVDGERAFLLIAGGAVFAKLVLIGLMTRFHLLALFAYVSVFFMLHDAVQLRAGLAATAMLLALFLYGRRFWLAAGGVWALGPLVHMQAAVLPVGALLLWVFRRRYGLALAVVALTQALVAVGLTPSVLVFALVEFESERVLRTLDESDGGSGLRLTTLVMIAALVMVVPAGVAGRWRDLAFYTVVAGFVLYWMTAGVGGVSNRLMQFMWVPICVLAPLAERRLLSFFGFLGVCLAFFGLSGWINGLLSHPSGYF